MVRWKLDSVGSATYRPNGKGKAEEGRRNGLTKRELLVLGRLSDLVCSLV